MVIYCFVTTPLVCCVSDDLHSTTNLDSAKDSNQSLISALNQLNSLLSHLNQGNVMTAKDHW